MEDVSCLTDGTEAPASETRGKERTCPENKEGVEDLRFLRDVLIRSLGWSPEFLEDMLRRHETCDRCQLWHALGEELLRERRGSLLEFSLQCYIPAMLAPW